ncbi:MAG TPA: hypothetical protein VNM37_14110, partial [Candidatus Dormibacteraeota bacterium]|nr:hypothetical protein [Candidatus Dormibacteraeota bacterium]
QHFKDFMEETRRAGTNQVPFTPRRHIIQTNYFRVNDPLVHYTMEDLDITQGTATLEPSAYVSGTLLLGTRNPNSIPWNNGGGSVAAPGSGALDPTIRDPGVISSDYWDFPTNRFPSIGWLGRVHRGTPWQTIYLKSKPPGGNWVRHSGPSRRAESAALMIPPRDWDLLDIFTAAHHPNATRGRLSINQTNAAAWSAVMAGVVVSGVTNDAGYGAIRALPEVVQPASVAPPMATIAAGITATRARRPGGQFQRFGQILSVPELTFRSPFLNTPDFSAEAPTGQAQVYDTDYERIPQQILGLIKLGEPRFVIYAWGQSLKPARRNPQDSGPSIVTSGTDRGLVSNYQITGETATRTVVKVNFERFDNGEIDYGRPHLQVESFNVLPNE